MLSAGIGASAALNGAADMISIMDHTPGQGQFKHLETYIAYMISNHGASRGYIPCLSFVSFMLLPRLLCVPSYLSGDACTSTKDMKFTFAVAGLIHRVAAY